MPRTGGEKTKAVILQTAKELFSEQGFEGTGIQQIAKTSGVNKATLYYHFDDKDHIIQTLFEMMITDIEAVLSSKELTNGPEAIKDKFYMELDFYGKYEQMLKVLLMESLKNTDHTNYLFKLVDMLQGKEDLEHFFLGIGPFLMYITLKEKWANYYHTDIHEMNEQFVNGFIHQHMAFHVDND